MIGNAVELGQFVKSMISGAVILMTCNMSQSYFDGKFGLHSVDSIDNIEVFLSVVKMSVKSVFIASSVISLSFPNKLYLE